MILVGADVWVKFLILTSVMAICQLIGQISMGNNYNPEWGAHLHLHCVTGINLIVMIWETTLILIAGKCLGGAHLHLHCVTVISSLVSTCNPALLTSHCHLVTCLALPCYHCLWIRPWQESRSREILEEKLLLVFPLELEKWIFMSRSPLDFQDF